jgi:acetyltransferase-like isoleucine patch superfamily enzyme
MGEEKNYFVHPSAFVEDNVTIGENTKVWHQVQIRTGAKIGSNCNFGKSVFIDTNVTIGDNVKIQNFVSVYQGVSIDDDVFVGPHVCFTNDLLPRARAPEWSIIKTKVNKGSSIGANSTIICGLTLGEYSMIGAGSLVSKDVQPFTLVFGNPARMRGYVCFCGEILRKTTETLPPETILHCSECQKDVML